MCFKRILLLQTVVLTIVLSSICVAWAQDPRGDSKKSEVELTVSAENVNFNAGSPLQVLIVLKNVSKSPVLLQVSCLELNYRFDVRRENGDPVPMTAEGERRSKVDPSACRRKTLLLQSGNSIRVGVDAALLYDFTKVGRYRICVKREFRTADGVWHKAESAPLHVTIE